jgi:hypothetical protein
MGVILETYQVGNALKITAIDEQSLEEVSFVAPLSASKHDIERLALQKLRYKEAKKKTADPPTDPNYY